MQHRYLAPFVIAAILVLVSGPVDAGPQARVSGVVVDTAGEPISGATVTITCEALPKYKKELTTGDDGTFKVLILDATKTYIFTTAADGYFDYKQEIKVMVGTTDNEFTFELSTPAEKAAVRKQELMEEPGYKEYGEARDLLAAGDTAGSRAKLEQAIAEMPDLIEAHEAITAIDYESGDPDLALESARRCLEIDDESLRCLAVAANAAGDLGDTDAQAAYLATYQELNPNDPATVFNQAVGYLNKMDDEGARPLLEECLAIDPGFANCLFQYGMVLLRSGDLEGAKAHLEKYLEVAPDGPDATAAAETVKYL